MNVEKMRRTQDRVRAEVARREAREDQSREHQIIHRMMRDEEVPFCPICARRNLAALADFLQRFRERMDTAHRVRVDAMARTRVVRPALTMRVADIDPP